MPDLEFEHSFANLAHTLLEQVPALVPFYIGFQIIDKNDDNTHAFGVHAFKVGDQWIYAPVFFNNGELKGKEMLVLKNQDLFVPATEGWVNYLINRRPMILGEETQTNDLSQLGVQSPDLSIFSGQSPVKVASAETIKAIYNNVAEHVRPFLRIFGVSPFDSQYKKAAEDLDLLRFIRAGGKPVAGKLLQWMKSSIKFANAILRFYTMDQIKQAVDDVIAGRTPIKSAAAEDSGSSTVVDTKKKVVVIRDANNIPSDILEILTPAEKRELLETGMTVHDTRRDDEVSVVYTTDFSRTLQAPNKPGYYDVLIRPARFRTCLVFPNAEPIVGDPDVIHFESVPVPVGSSDAAKAPDPVALCVDEQNGDYFVAKPKDVLTKRDSLKRIEYGEFHDVTTMMPDKYYAIIAPGVATTPFKVLRRVDMPDGIIRFCIDPKVGVRDQRSEIAGNHWDHVCLRENAKDVDNKCIGYHISVLSNAKSSEKLQKLRFEAFVPGDYKVIELKKEIITMEPGRAVDLEMHLQSKLAAASVDPEFGMLRVYTDGTTYYITANGRQSPAMSKNAAAAELVQNHGVRYGDAKRMLKLRPGSSAKFIVKYAQAYTLTQSGPSMPAVPPAPVGTDAFLGTGTIMPQDQELPVIGMSRTGNPVGDPNYVLRNDDIPLDAMQTAQQAAATGQKEVVDTAVVGSLLKTLDIDELIDRYLGDMIQGMDRIGRILFLLYWHAEAFKERFGSQDLPELEDNLRNVFKNLGEVILFLKQKTIEAGGESAEPKLRELPNG